MITLLDLYMGSHLHCYNIIQIWHVYNNVSYNNVDKIMSYMTFIILSTLL